MEHVTSNSDVVKTANPIATHAKNSWSKRFSELEGFKEREGHCKVPTKYPTNPSLASWVSSQRKHYNYMLRGKPSSMTEERVLRLEEIGFVWKAPRSGGVKPDEKKWMKYFDELKLFKEENGHCKVPQRYPENPRLGVWVHMQRVNYKYRVNGDERSSMNEKRIRDLESIGFVWQEENSKFRPDNDTWMERYEELKKFKEIYGHCRVPRGFFDNPSLGNWVSSQRTNYKKYREGKKSTMTESRVRALENVGFLWHRSENIKGNPRNAPLSELPEVQEKKNVSPVENEVAHMLMELSQENSDANA